MTDRTPTQVLENGAIRYGVYDENGNLLRYEWMKPEDEPTNPGTPLNKATLLTDETVVRIFGTSIVNNPTVNDALGQISPLYNGVWQRRVENLNMLVGEKEKVDIISGAGTNSTVSSKVYYSSTVEYSSEEGKYFLVEPIEYSVLLDESISKYDENILKGKYWRHQSGEQIYYTDTTDKITTEVRASGVYGYYYVYVMAKEIEANSSPGVWETEISNDSNEYISGYDSTTDYESNFSPSYLYSMRNYLKIQPGRYIGTGTNSTALTFDFVPRVVLVFGAMRSSDYNGTLCNGLLIMTFNPKLGFAVSDTTALVPPGVSSTELNGKTVSWQGASNVSGAEYLYLGLG